MEFGAKEGNLRVEYGSLFNFLHWKMAGALVAFVSPSVNPVGELSNRC